jgi:hypothetical protein
VDLLVYVVSDLLVLSLALIHTSACL